MPCYKIPLLLRVEPQLLGFEVADETGQRPTKGANFIYKPWKNPGTKSEFVWHKGETGTIRVFVEYPLMIDMTFDRVCALLSGAKAIAYYSKVPFKARRAPHDVSMFEVKVKPLESGKLLLRGVSISWNNVVCEHYVNSKGVGVYATDYETRYKQDVCEIQVVEGIPRLSSRVEAIQITNGKLVGLRDELCPVTTVIKNISPGRLGLSRLELQIHLYTTDVLKQKEKKSLFQKVDLMQKFGKIEHDRWYEVQSVIPIQEDTRYDFEMYFASEPAPVIVERHQIAVTVRRCAAKFRPLTLSPVKTGDGTRSWSGGKSCSVQAGWSGAGKPRSCALPRRSTFCRW